MIDIEEIKKSLSAEEQEFMKWIMQATKDAHYKLKIDDLQKSAVLHLVSARLLHLHRLKN